MAKTDADLRRLMARVRVVVAIRQLRQALAGWVKTWTSWA
jgi:hypothetical protein